MILKRIWWSFLRAVTLTKVVGLVVEVCGVPDENSDRGLNPYRLLNTSSDFRGG